MARHDTVKLAAGLLRTRRRLAEIAVKVVPNASRTEIVGFLAGVLKVRVTAPPEGGRANRALEAVIATALGVKRAAVAVTGGHGAARKRVAIEGLDEAEILRRLVQR
jgi:uncharacterized protein YggU (UPF0235/DUF167 family)